MAMNKFNYAALPTVWVACPVCASTEFRTLACVDRYRMGIQTCQCGSCGLILTNPMPTESDLAAFYRHSYRRFYRGVEAPSQEHIRDYRLTERASYTSAYLQQACLLPKGASILDVGCAEGSLLRAVGTRVHASRRVGIEPNPSFGGFARSWAGADVYTDLETLERTSPRFDLVLVNHVLEHLREPVAFLNRISMMLTEGGKIYVDVPDATRYESVNDLHLAHLYHFTSASLANVASQAGLTVQVMEAHDPVNHPKSLRAVFYRASSPGLIRSDPKAESTAMRIRAIAGSARRFFLRRSLAGRILVGGPKRLWQVLSRTGGT